MVQRGAKHLVFLSRSGASKPLAASLISRLEAQGVEVTILRSDVASKKHIEAIMAHIDPKYPIRGIINAAMILDVSIGLVARRSRLTNSFRIGCSTI